jgi:hypothetical protein
MSTPPNPPLYIYKILPSSTPPPSPLPLALPVSELDRRDNFIHLSTSRQLLGTLRNFFADEEKVYVLRIPYARVQRWIRWEDAKGKTADEVVSVFFLFFSSFCLFCALLYLFDGILNFEF